MNGEMCRYKAAAPFTIKEYLYFSQGNPKIQNWCVRASVCLPTNSKFEASGENTAASSEIETSSSATYESSKARTQHSSNTQYVELRFTFS